MIEGRLPSAERGRRRLAALVAAAMVLALLPFGAASAEDRLNMTVLEGADNVAAAIAWSQQTFPEGETVTNAILGRDDLPPDNLASGMLQGELEGPLLLNPTNSLDPDVSAELERLEVRTVHILGGTSAISANVENSLKSAGYAVRRYAGTTRLETAQTVAGQHAGSATTALLARAFGTSADQTSAWADALAGGAWAAETGFPVLFTQTETLSASTRNYLQTSRITTVIILGGAGAVSPAVETQIQALGKTVRRVSGATRFATAIAIAEERGYDDAGDAAEGIVLADGQDEDAWAAGFAAAGYAADKPIVLSNGANLPSETDTWFANGTDDTPLIVAPYVTEAAATAAADKLGLGKKATVTLDDTSIGVGEDITGKVTPMDDVDTVEIEGDCVEEDNVSPSATTGAFSEPMIEDFEPGECDITITVTYDNDDVTVHEFDVTVTAPPPTPAVLDRPELTNITVHNQTDDFVVLKYTFDEPVDLVANAGNEQEFSLQDFDADPLQADVADEFGEPVQEADDANAILASFNKQDYNEATVAFVAAGVVADRDGDTNPEGNRSLKSVTFEAGRTDRPDFISASSPRRVDADTTSGVDYMVEVDFNFDTPVTVADAEDPGYQVMTKSGVVHTASKVASGNGTNKHVVRFGGTVGTPDASFGTSETNADTFKNDIRRAIVPSTATVEDEWGQDHDEVTQTVNIGSVSTLTIPNLDSVTLLPDTNQVRYTFTANVDDPSNNEEDFFVYDHSGNKISGTTGEDPVRDTSNLKQVIVTFAEGQIDDQITAGGVEDGAVNDQGAAGDVNKVQTVPVTGHTYAAGETLAPDLERVIVTPNSEEDPFGGSDVTAYDVIFRFDQALTGVDPAAFRFYDEEGTVYDFTTECAADPDVETDVVCEVEDDNDGSDDHFDEMENAVLFVAEANAVDKDPVDSVDAANRTYSNYASAKVPT